METLAEAWNIEGTIQIPLLGEVAAGAPLEVYSVEETLDVPESLWKGRKVFALRVRGRSMVDAGIRDGDYLIVEPRVTADDGRTVVAEVDGRVTVKKLFREPNGRIRLQPANPEMLPLLVSGDDVRIRGVVVGVLRKYGFREPAGGDDIIKGSFPADTPSSFDESDNLIRTTPPPTQTASPPAGGEAERCPGAGTSSEAHEAGGAAATGRLGSRPRGRLGVHHTANRREGRSDGATLELALNAIDAQIIRFKDFLAAAPHLNARERAKLAALGRDLQALREWCARTGKPSLRRALIADAAKLVQRMNRLSRSNALPPDVTLH